MGSASSGSPRLYTPELATEICLMMAEGFSLREICRAEKFPAESTVRLWAIEDLDGFAARYARAREAQADRWVDEIVEIADDGSNDWMERQRRDGSTEVVLDREHVQRSTLRVEARKWLMMKLAPKRYGDAAKAVLVETTPVAITGGLPDEPAPDGPAAVPRIDE